MAEKLNLTRAQLADFLRNHEQIKQFEKLFGATNLNSETIELINDRLFLLENPPGLFIDADHLADTDAYWIVATVTGLTVTLPKAASDLIGKVWHIMLDAAGQVTISTSFGDTFKTPDSTTETSAILNRRGSAVAFRCISLTEWGFA